MSRASHGRRRTPYTSGGALPSRAAARRRPEKRPGLPSGGKLRARGGPPVVLGVPPATSRVAEFASCTRNQDLCAWDRPLRCGMLPLSPLAPPATRMFVVLIGLSSRRGFAKSSGICAEQKSRTPSLLPPPRRSAPAPVGGTVRRSRDQILG